MTEGPEQGGIWQFEVSWGESMDGFGMWPRKFGFYLPFN